MPGPRPGSTRTAAGGPGYNPGNRGGAQVRGPLTQDDLDLFHRDGYVIKRDWFDGEEMERLARFAREDPDLVSHNFPVKDTGGRESRLTLWNHPGDDL